jgi:hypothetical protein
MRLTIVPDDGAVYKDRVSYSGLSLPFVPSNVHALQWYGEYGEIEFKSSFVDGRIVKPENEVITTLPSWADQAVAAWEEANTPPPAPKPDPIPDTQPTP